MISTKYPIWSHSGDGRIDLNWKEFGNALLNATPNGIAVFSKSFQTIISNKIARSSLDIYPGALLDTTIPHLKTAIRKVLETKQTVTDIEIKKKGNSFSARLSPIYHGTEFIGIMSVFEDMTTIEKISDQMVSYQDLSIELDTIIDSSNDGLWICDGKGTVLRINPASEKLTDIKAAEIVGKNIVELVEKKIIDKSVTLEVLKTKKKVSIIQQTRNGKQLFLTGNPVFDIHGSLFRVVVNERDITDITKLQQKLEEKAQLNDQYKRDLLEKQIEETELQHIIAKSDNYLKIIQKAIKLGEVDSTVLILGESGTGKGVIADLIHKYSTRGDHPMIKINCGSIPESLVESELFGYAAGAFTGARQKGKPGKFELADKGIIFLDEIAELPLGSQVKLLKFLEDGVISRVGGTGNKHVDVRIIAATNRDLKRMIEKKQFRSDLYYRLNVVPLKIPPLRQRKECLVPLIHYYLNLFCKKYEKKKMTPSSEALDALMTYPYPGNVREMINICERLVVMSQNNTIAYKDLPGSVQKKITADTPALDDWHPGQTLQEMVEEMEKNILTTVLKKCRTQANAAKILGLNQSTIARKLKKYRLA
ncbi:sigma 54-interacting transcriptional regulator [Desulfobacula sp.]|uniref:sigma 54-interacting transcriptional regulator n=1 Tax=Desulfobacula sp. TaxID=2593537 RepID=UPI00261EBEE2|nr:sigma 54-interacting transcriptional regulator [Desulfobacula sp.]